ncbi:MAG: HK97 gp10 family phage protein [Theionarchaea archaeon]|nr:HK97 gp10 family phage protein [Theionarchaea archaeon]
MKTGIKIEGLEAVLGNLDRLTDEIEKSVGAALYKGGLTVEGTAKELVHVKTGFLRGSINTQQLSWDLVEVGTNCEYGPFQEFGTWKMEAHPYLYPALDQNIEMIYDMVTEGFTVAVEAIAV